MSTFLDRAHLQEPWNNILLALALQCMPTENGCSLNHDRGPIVRSGISNGAFPLDFSVSHVATWDGWVGGVARAELARRETL